MTTATTPALYAVCHRVGEHAGSISYVDWETGEIVAYATSAPSRILAAMPFEEAARAQRHLDSYL